LCLSYTCHYTGAGNTLTKQDIQFFPYGSSGPKTERGIQKVKPTDRVQTITSVKEAGSATINDGAWRPFPLEGGWERCHRDTTTTEKGERARPGIKRQG
jgi:hypothetical protein